MTKHLEHIYDVLQNANSKKVTDRRNCVGSLLHLYENKEIIAEICESSKHNTNIVTWSYIIHTIHKLLISEADRLASKEISNKSEVERNICLLVENTFRHADFNKKSLLKCNDVMPLILQVISRTTYKPYYDTYLKVLISYVLPLRIHQVNMLPEFWEELLDVLCKLYKHVSSVISKRAVLDALHMSVQYGCLHSNVNLNVSDILSFIESTLPSVVKAQEVLADSFYKLTNTVCRHIAAEYRIVLCHFSETVSSRLSSLKGPIEKYEVLLLFVRIHHPEGVSKGDDRAYANDWTQWYAELRNMYVNILKDFKAGELPRTFVRYAAEDCRKIKIGEKSEEETWRSLNVNQNETSTHTLTQLFIINNKITNPNVVLKLYLTNVIKWSVMSVRTLIVLCEHFPLPADISVCSINEYSPTMDANSVRSSLIKWLLNIPWQRTVTEIIIDELCLSLISMTLKTKHENRIRFKEYNVNDQCDCLEDENSESFYEHIEQCYLLLTYKKNLFTDDAKRSEKLKAKVNEHVLYMQEILTFMTNSLYSMINETVRGDLDVIIIKVAIVAKAVSMMKELNMISKNIEELQLVQGLKKYMANVNTLLERLNPSKENYSYLYRVTKALCSLYETSYDVQVAEIIVSSATLNMLKNIFNLMNIADDEIAKYEISKNYINQQRRRKCLNREDVEEECCKYCDKGTIRIQATKALALFCCITVEQESSHEIQIKLMNNFLNINMYDLSHTVNFKMAVMVLKSLSMYGEGRLWENHRYSPLENLLTLHRTCYKDETSMRYIFSVFPYFFKYSLEHDSCKINDLMKIIVEFNKLRSEKKRYGFVAQIEYVKCLSEIIRISPSHLHYSTNEALDEMSVLEGLLSSLTSSSFMVRKEAIKWIQSIYSSKSIAFLWKEALFARIEALARAIAIDEKTNVRINADKKEITTASTLLTLGAIASTSGAFQSQALSLMLQFIIDNEIDCEKMLKTINIATDRVNCSNLIEKNLSFLLTYWYNSEYSSRSFPWKLMRCESETQFYQTCSNTLAFIKFKRLDLPEVASVCNRANLPFEQVIENIFPEVLAWLLYCVDGNERTISKQSAYEVFHKFQSNEDEFCRMREFSSLLNGNFAKILVYLVGRLHDEDHLEETLGIRMSLALSDPPHFKKPAIDNCLKLIVSNYFQDGVTLLEYLLRCNGSRILQRVLSDLNERIHKQGFEEHRIKAFHQYAYFCTLVIDELPREYFDAMSTYVIKDIGYSLLHVIKIYDDVRRLACRYFYDFVKRMFPVRSEQVKQILKFTVAVLVPIVQTEETSVALDILNFLIVDQKALLSDVIQNLNVFPNIPVFQRIREIHNNLKHQTKRVHTLEEEIQYFLNTMIDKNMDCSMEDISHLLMQLSTRKEELRRLYDALEKFRGFSEDCATSLLHQLVYKLIKLTGSAEMDVSIEAARCLGELGPTDLMSMILYLEKGHIKESSDLIEILSYKIIIMMVKFLFESDIELRRISAGVLNVVLSSFWGRQLLNATYMNSLKSVLGESQVPPLETSNIQPFILANDKCLKESNIGINETNLNEILDQDNTIWTIQSEDSYSDWIVQATCKVAVCFTRFYSEYLIPVCRLSTDFCEMILPRIVYLIIHTDENSTSAIWKCIDRFFEHHFNFNTETNVPSHKSTNCDHRIVRCMLNIVNYIRMQIPSNHLKLNYIHIAKAAHYCSAYFTAILYAEMSCEAILNDDDRSTSVSKIDRVYQLSPRQGKVIQGILRDSYAKLGDLDAISGTGSSHLQHYSTRIQHYVHTNQWDRVMLANDVELSCLGELGPTDLMSMILYLEKGHIKESSDLIEILSYKIIIMMVKFLFESDIELRRISAGVLNVVLSSFWGRQLLNATYMNSLKSVLGESQVPPLETSNIQPFILANDKCLKESNIGINETNLNEILDQDNTIWTIQSEDSYSDWIVQATCKVAVCFTRFYSEYLIPVCRLSTDFCEMILPRIVYLIIHTDENSTSAIWKCIDRFFEHHFNFNTETNVPSHKSTNCDHRIVRCMLNIVNYIRMQIPSNHLKLNYIHIAKAAHYCSAYFTAILYAEMSCEAILNDDDRSTSVSKIDRVYQLSPRQGKVIQGILRDSYAKLGDLDAISGTGSSHLQHYSTRIQHYVHTNQWDRVMLANDVELSFGNTSMIREMANGLHQSGLQYLLGNFISMSSKTGEKIDEDILYESAWRLGNWDALDGNQFLYSQNNFGSKLDITERDYHFYHYHALKCFHEGNEGGVADAIRNARASVIKALRNTSLESNKTIYKKLTQLQLIREIEDLKFVKENDYGKVLDKWQQQNIANFNDFRYMEPILTQRTVMFQINDTLANNSNIKHALFNTYLQLSKIAADKDNLQIATRSLVVLAKQSDLSSKIQDRLLYQEALLARHRNDLDVGRCLLLNLINKNTLDGNLRAQILRVYGDWMAETKSENPQTVIEEYYLRSINLSMSINEQSNDHEIVKNLHDTQVALARFADTQFEQISSYMKSPQFEILKECVTYSYKTIDEQSVPEDRDVRQAMFLSRRQNTNDAEELEHIQKERNNYLILALKYYLRTLQQSESYNLLVFRVIALWLDNVHHKEVNDLLEENLNFIPSFKFIPLVPQLAAHITEDLDQFHAKIYNIMRRCALEHPHHTLPVLLALKNLYGDCDNSSIRKGKTPEPRVLGARKLLKELGKFNIRKIIFEMERLSRALVTLANLPATSAKAGVIVKIPKNQEILKIKQFESIYVPTLRINVNPSQHYNSVVGVAKYAETYETVGGINTPKKLVCIGTDGISRYQLIKGKDDLRQDAVMQQVFTVMNTLLRSHEETKRRKLAIRTYKVVPLTQRSGIVEWCDNTLPIAAVLVGTDSLPGLHKKYYPRDYTARQCKEKLAAATKYTPSRKLKVYMDCCEHMHPVMHHFFTEKYPSPETWFERRLAYTRSIATTSMAGYVLGLGDRHLNNILIDQTTAEVIHIDFGIAFEQGKVLPMPETIPFRLTRNIEAGMGVSGVEGTMRHCSEKTLTVLRDQKQIIITLLQVLLYDPLFKWTITPAKAHDIQSERSSRSVENNQYSTETNKSAERALLRIEQKLQGTEEGLVTSVSGQVERLIQEARDPMNLCRVFCGWQPYL
ncbi:serine-protein kinase ATM [Ceratina calcarata]|uniref:Serine/threonine-protein kinase ATM n=1 Tax=Ceratina calcarata TaxID=156304 RepID=A0AAJ7J0J9_9HYME|nr:serine-protein kinase ATM [Ceratina calcarata]